MGSSGAGKLIPGAFRKVRKFRLPLLVEKSAAFPGPS